MTNYRPPWASDDPGDPRERASFEGRFTVAEPIDVNAPRGELAVLDEWLRGLPMQMSAARPEPERAPRVNEKGYNDSLDAPPPVNGKMVVWLCVMVACVGLLTVIAAELLIATGWLR